MKQILLVFLIFLFSERVYSQVEMSENDNLEYIQIMHDSTQSKEGVNIVTFKDSVDLKIIIDSVIIGRQTIHVNKTYQRRIDYEFGEINLAGDTYLRIYLARNQEEGEKFYSWKWSYFRKGKKMKLLGSGFYNPIVFGTDYYINFSQGSQCQGIGYKDTEDYVYVCYRYSLK